MVTIRRRPRRSVILEAFLPKIPNAAQKNANYNPVPCAGEE